MNSISNTLVENKVYSINSVANIWSIKNERESKVEAIGDFVGSSKYTLFVFSIFQKMQIKMNLSRIKIDYEFSIEFL